MVSNSCSYSEEITEQATNKILKYAENFVNKYMDDDLSDSFVIQH